ncbi:EAL domain-containing protein [Nitrosophilus kaiyonis]|uniref:EAL domain-containing protein n=1 Tax=Nitrosophilus kaiyonis TaxID=2930200 RepID=UPI00249047F6|nr:GGDEF and EAL domain-containing protein [Nitrosophilus kaiyonis]
MENVICRNFEYEDIFFHGPVIVFKIYIKNLNNIKIDYISSNVYEQLGYTQKEIMSDDFDLKKIIPLDYEIFLERIKNSIKDKDLKYMNLNHTYKVMKKSGEKCYMKAYTKIIRDEDKKPLYFKGYLINVHDEIITRKKLENVINGAKLGYWIWDLRTNFHQVNDNWLEILGLKREDLKNSIEDWSSRVHPDDINRVLKEVEEHIKYKKPYKTEFRMKHKNGSWIWIESIGGVVEYSLKDQKPVLMCGTHQDITQRKLNEKEISYLAFHDQLTKLPNRALLYDRINHALLHSKRFHKKNALIFIDLDNFKYINDSFGHEIGDKVLKKISRRLKKSVREIDTVSRLGGDEFVILLEDLENENAADYAYLLANKILEKIKKPINIDNFKYYITASLGITIFPEENENLTVNKIVKHADNAMYYAKSLGKNSIKFFNKDINEKNSKKIKIQLHMKDALKKGKFDVFYQPIIDLKYEKTVGLEALLRWKDDNIEFKPSEFIPVAEENSLIIDISDYVIKWVCKDIENRKIFELMPDLKYFSINLSVKLFNINGFEKKIKSIIDKYCIDPSLLNFELTENVLIQNFNESIEKINDLKKLGIQFSIDDFGTGYSSLKYLKKLPVDIIKIDKSFIKDIDKNFDNRKIVESIIDIANHFELKTVAEGVEREIEKDILKELGCDFAQGFYFSKPKRLKL